MKLSCIGHQGSGLVGGAWEIFDTFRKCASGWHVYGTENVYNFPCACLLRVNTKA